MNGKTSTGSILDSFMLVAFDLFSDVSIKDVIGIMSAVVANFKWLNNFYTYGITSDAL